MSSLEQVLKAYEGPDQFFLHNINAGHPCGRRQFIFSAIGAQAADHRVVRGSALTRSWWSQTESNRRHPACKAGALPTELWPRSSGTVRAQESIGACHDKPALKQRTPAGFALAPPGKNAGRPGQTRTADLTLIRRAL
jgi:hypothetical protein